ncbi:FeoA family protein [Gilvimarinus sp. SDUM040013]|nr:FeoA family protein [Gilvimarinus sp. SDUM040013]MDO3386773.1 FeoA family protein [Gilvimarinus sp. SDUM040013]
MASTTLPLHQCSKGQTVRLLQVASQQAFADQDELVSLRLKELGFLPGAVLTVLGFGFLGRDPIAVKIGRTKFALRRAEASKLIVEPVAAEAPTEGKQ